MTEKDGSKSNVSEVAKAIAAVTENVPIYDDAMQPAAKELGKGLETVAKAVNAALAPVEGFIWGVEKIKEFVRNQVAEKLENVPPEEISAPPPHIGVPAIDALRYTGSQEELAALYANLLATSMDRKTAYHAHPAFVDIIKNLCPDEAKIMRFLSSNIYYPLINIKLIDNTNNSFQVTHRYVSLLGLDSQCQHPGMAANYIDNLERLGLVHVSELTKMSEQQHYDRIKEHPQIAGILEDYKNIDGKRPEAQEIRLEVTDLGKQFSRACVIDKQIQARG